MQCRVLPIVMCEMSFETIDLDSSTDTIDSDLSSLPTNSQDSMLCP